MKKLFLTIFLSGMMAFSFGNQNSKIENKPPQVEKSETIISDLCYALSIKVYEATGKVSAGNHYYDTCTGG